MIIQNIIFWYSIIEKFDLEVSNSNQNVEAYTYSIYLISEVAPNVSTRADCVAPLQSATLQTIHGGGFREEFPLVTSSRCQRADVRAYVLGKNEVRVACKVRLKVLPDITGYIAGWNYVNIHLQE